MDNSRTGPQERFPGGPYHVKRSGSTWETKEDGISRYDPKTAHTRAGDPDFEVRLPETCGACRAQELSRAAQDAVSGGEAI